jgi:hypothetical protein
MNLARKLAIVGAVTPYLIPKDGFYKNGLPSDIALRFRLRTMWIELALRARLFIAGAIAGLKGEGIIGVARLYASVIRANGTIEHFGLVSTKKVTTAGVNYLVDAWQNSVELESMKYHGVGTGTNAESNGDTALQTESTTALNPDSTRATGSTTEGGSANVFRSVGTVTFDGSAAITERHIQPGSDRRRHTVGPLDVLSNQRRQRRLHPVHVRPDRQRGGVDR